MLCILDMLCFIPSTPTDVEGRLVECRWNVFFFYLNKSQGIDGAAASGRREIFTRQSVSSPRSKQGADVCTLQHAACALWCEIFVFFFLLLYFLLNIRCTFERGMSMGILSENTFPIALSTLVNIDNNCYDDGWEG